MTELELMKQEMAKLTQENARLKATQRGGKLTFRVSTKGGVSVYGLGKFPVTLFKSQWKALIAVCPELNAFIDTNTHLLTEKNIVAIVESKAATIAVGGNEAA